MSYLFLLIALFAGATKGYCGKKTSGYVNEYTDAMLANSLRMFLCIVIGFVMLIISNGIHGFKMDCKTLSITLVSGLANSAFIVLWLIAVKKGAYMMLDVFCTIGILIPMIGCAILFNESITVRHIAGIAILLIAVCIMCSYNNSIKHKITARSLCLLLFCGISNGVSDFSQKLFIKMSEGVSVATFNFYTYLFSGIILLGCYFAFSYSSTNGKKTDIRPIFAYILIMSVCLFLYSYFKTVAAKYLSAAELYPLAQGGALILSTIMSAAFFHERINAKCIIGVVMTFLALFIINVL